MYENIFKACYFICLIAGSVIRAIYTRHRKKNKITDDRKTVLDAVLMTIPGIGMFILPVILVASSWLDFADYHLHPWAGWIGPRHPGR